MYPWHAPFAPAVEIPALDAESPFEFADTTIGGYCFAQVLDHVIELVPKLLERLSNTALKRAAPAGRKPRGEKARDRYIEIAAALKAGSGRNAN